MKKKILVIIVLIIVFVLGIFVWMKTNPIAYITDNEFLYDVAIDYVENEEKNNSEYRDKDDFQVFTDYKGFGISEKNDEKYAYMWILEETHYAENGEMQIGSGSSMPYKFTFKNNKVVDVENSKDGSYYVPSIKKMFPKDVASRILNFTMDNSKLDKEVKEHYAYLEDDNFISSVTNSTKPYIPDGIEVANPNDISSKKAEDREYNRNPENVIIKVIEDTISRDSASILITDNNEDKYGWGTEFYLQKKENENWENMNLIKNDIGWEDIAYNLDKNNQLILKVEYGDYYGTLEDGIYRIEKRVYDNGYISIYSNEFEIK